MKGKVSTILSVCPIRTKPADSAEMISQLLFGETAVVVASHKKDWTRIRLDYDECEGWIDSKQLVAVKDIDPEGTAYSLEIFEKVFADDRSTWISLGAELSQYDGMTARVAEHTFRFSGQAIRNTDVSPDKESIEKMAKKLLNTPYLPGGRTPMGIDCSGFTQLVYKCVGLRIGRDSGDQVKQGRTVDFVSTAETGDLAFFSRLTDQITHVGIILPDRNIIHASGRVRIDTLDHYGIFNKEIQEYTHRLKIIKRYY